MTEESLKFNVYHFSQPAEERLFSKRNEKLLFLLPGLNDAVDNLFSHTPKGESPGRDGICWADDALLTFKRSKDAFLAVFRPPTADGVSCKR